MEIVFVTREPDVCSLFVSRLENADVSCRIQSDFLTFFLQLQKGKIYADLLVCDFCEFHHIMLDFHKTLLSLHKPMPVVFYNDPYPNAENRVGYWISQNERLYRGCEFHQFTSVFQSINIIIEDPAIRPHISLLRPPIPLCDMADNSFSGEQFDLNWFRLRNKMPPAIFSLFEYFYGNLSKEVTIKAISRRMSAPYFKSSVQKASVYSYVSRLKKYIKTDSPVKFNIIRTSYGCYKMVRC